jgi:hypothetical protein
MTALRMGVITSVMFIFVFLSGSLLNHHISAQDTKPGSEDQPPDRPPSTNRPDTTFHHPSSNNYRIDICLNWGERCGAPAAHKWCQSQGFARAIEWEIDEDIGAKSPTYILASGEICDIASCDGFSWIRCSN